jgi:hypothetical protein
VPSSVTSPHRKPHHALIKTSARYLSSMALASAATSATSRNHGLLLGGHTSGTTDLRSQSGPQHKVAG